MGREPVSDTKSAHAFHAKMFTGTNINASAKHPVQSQQLTAKPANQRTKRFMGWRWAGVDAVLSFSLAAAGVAYWRIHLPTLTSQTVSANPIAETIDLSQSGTTRGAEASAFPPVTLPRRLIMAHLLLPYFSPGGKYGVSVTMDRN
jgi:hypothetical protein